MPHVSKAKGARQLCVYRVYTSYACHPSNMSFSDFYGSDLTDISSSSGDDEEFTLPGAKRTGTKKARRDQQAPYTITNPLRPPRSTSYSVRALYGPPFLPIPCFLLTLSPRTNRRWIDQLRSGLSKRYQCLSSFSAT